MKWWQKSVIYQIYPKSFKDSNGDGIGDIRGIIEKVDYIASLGVDAVWLCPVFDSPQDDNGYDICDYRKIYPPFGTNEDMYELIELFHAHNIKVIMDLVVNHTSSMHPWFIESRKSKDNPYRDYYIWKDPINGKEPNNWGSFFSGSAWEFDEATEQYYLHYFAKSQPDLNWENPELRREVWEIMHYWMQRGVDGWRLDVITSISKHHDFPNYSDTRYKPFFIGDFHANGPRLHEFLHEMHTEVMSKYDGMTVGEAPGSDAKKALLFTAPKREELDMIITFDHMLLDAENKDFNGKWSLKRLDLLELKESLASWQQGLHAQGWNSLYFENHDQPRIISRWGNDKEYRKECAGMFAVLELFMQGTPFIYQGQELGMTNCQFELEEYNDLEIHNAHKELVEDLKSISHEDFMKAVYLKSRDNARTPMQWDNSTHSGFSRATPWLKVNPRYTTINAEREQSSEDSVLNTYRELIYLRKSEEVVATGTFELVMKDHTSVFAYRRDNKKTTLFIYCNFSDQLQDITEKAPENATLLFTNYKDVETHEESLAPYEARIYKSEHF